MLSALNPRWSIRLLFSLIALCFGVWTYNIAAFKIGLGLTRSELAFALLALPVGMTATFTQSPRLTRILGARKMILLGIGFAPILIIGLALSPWVWLSAIFVFGLGICSGNLEVGLSAVAQKIDRDDAPIVSSCHGFWSIGLGLGAFLSGLLSEFDVSFLTQASIIAPLVIYCLFWWTQSLPIPRASSVDDHGYALPTFALLPLCLLPFAGLFIEGAVADWNTEFLKHERGWSDVIAGTIGLTFMGGMAISRLTGDWLRIKFGAKILFISSTLISIIGMGFYAQSDLGVAVTIGAFLAGLGAGNVYPLTLVVANEGRSEEEFAHILSAIALVSFNAFVLAPVIMGFVGEHFSLSVSFALTIPLLALTFLWLKLAKITS